VPEFFEARIVAVADAVDAILCPRCYRAALTPARAIAELEQDAGTQFDPRLAALAVSLVRSDALRDLL
jgi:putative two-component system response regulator